MIGYFNVRIERENVNSFTRTGDSNGACSGSNELSSWVNISAYSRRLEVSHLWLQIGVLVEQEGYFDLVKMKDTYDQRGLLIGVTVSINTVHAGNTRGCSETTSSDSDSCIIRCWDSLWNKTDLVNVNRIAKEWEHNEKELGRW